MKKTILKLPAFIFSLACIAASGHALAEENPITGKDKHMGVATCASSVCHGKPAPDANSYALLNEYRTWSREDLHSKAYKILFNAESKRMAKNLGLASAHTADICLDCHADNVPQSQRGPKFVIRDGVGCEACHGGSEKWLDSHYKKGVTHAENLAAGMYPTESPKPRAEMCLSCHLGTKDKFATHRIMGAGHPRLAFELETFTANQPAHYVVDQDYLERKGQIESVTMWVAGVYYTAKQTLELYNSHLLTANGMIPELSFYDCHACHHPMDKKTWRQTSIEVGLKPGDLRLNDAALQMLVGIAYIRDQEGAQRLLQLSRDLHVASRKDVNGLRSSAKAALAQLASMEGALLDRNYNNNEITSLRQRILSKSAAGQYRDYTSAEQAFLGVETLTLALNQSERYSAQMDSFYASLASESAFQQGRFASVAKNLLSTMYP
ncbi:multiheme c-type cytochrome [uncultured Pseudoteredinibacter sp.]|uniref:multiheme c-type cytochrome n=1 Tax=uncultured Pseudoteredinibacter sp. TaxID=1641701 RepID=UPI00263686AA|nr:multiheme c-type cytochrome [uncultured Pseudoteredinibacter sp.]